ncbi:biotin-dependent carboxyltransferase family protein [Hyphococcus sp.]|uniref:5-oxoprolinase subunit C family protein n=1 Tax=Hyphococcus sp. TaxID=2038636 RepID=UPI003D121275
MTALADILSPGLLTTIQDLGRSGLRHLGVPLSGAADFVSLALANAAAGNAPNAEGLECTLKGPALRFAASATFVLGGADMKPQLNGKPLSLYKPFEAKAGDELVLGSAQTGARAYIAFAGGLQGDEFLGSSSTYLPASLGGHQGRALKAGDKLFSASLPTTSPRNIPASLHPAIAHDFFLRALPGPEADQLRDGDLTRFFARGWSVGRRADRMGVQLDGEKLSLADAPSMASSPVFPGTVQCPPDGAPFLLLCDAQTVGGYPRIAQVIAADLHLAGQMRPGDRVWFQEISAKGARDTALQKASFYGDLLPLGFFR